MNIAVIGSGLAGLTAAYFLSSQHHITLYEKAPSPGLDSQSVDVPVGNGATLRVDVPMRVFFENYYPTLTQLYRDLNIAFAPVDCASSWHDLDGQPYFAYRNVKIGGYSLPLPFAHRQQWTDFAQISRDLVRLIRLAPREIAEGRIAADEPLESYLQRAGYSQVFTEKFIVPLFAAIGTCSYASTRCFPAIYCLDYLSKLMQGFKPFQRVTSGTVEVAQRLIAPVQEARLNTGITAVAPHPNGIMVQDDRGEQRLFDHVIIATPAFRARAMLDAAFEPERAALSYFPYEKTTVLVHTDARLAPRNRRTWTAINGIYSPAQERIMATLWVNPVLKRLDLPDIFQTDDPILEPDPAKVFSTATFERAVVSMSTPQGLAQLDRLHAQPDRRVWFCGAYAAPGIPLLEGAASSALKIVGRLGSYNHVMQPAPH